MTSLKAFTKFPELPPEIQLQIWESTIATQPAMHLFDVCVPPCVSESTVTTIASPTIDSHMQNSEETDRSPSKREAIYLDEATDTLYLSPLATTTTEDAPPPGTEVSTQGARFRSDPSMYKFRADLAATCIDAAATVRRSMPTAPRSGSDSSGDTNTIYIGAPSTARGCPSITYDNTQDVLYLRFTPPAFRFPDGGRLTSPVSAIFESVWSQELAGALHRARRVAIDVSQLWPDLWARGVADGGEQQQGGHGGEEDDGEHEGAGEGGVGVSEEREEEEEETGDNDDGSLIMQDIAFLACTMQHDLEVLYLVDYCAGRCDCHLSSLKAQDLMERRDEGLYRDLRNGETWQKEKLRKPDVIQGVGKVWREVFDLEKLGWDGEHPGFVFAEMFAEVIKMQQGDWMGDDSQDGEVTRERAKFQGVRVLVAEDEQLNGEDNSIVLRCDGHRQGTKKEDHDL
ncbi:hypothetical protein LA080_007614 [Diaporthe eres]|uniref:2EXR domain-containing protein n=1 Tax=Diaporthe vaccinii TaxID=105482 RepID=A0ABR4FFD5_9PEZI|nr:hypothetical protein LA080_007614 [Diaporthe eres]